MSCQLSFRYEHIRIEVSGESAPKQDTARTHSVCPSKCGIAPTNIVQETFSPVSALARWIRVQPGETMSIEAAQPAD
jgi:hypothetical protein